MDSEWSMLLMDVLEVKPLNGDGIPKPKFGRSRPVGLPRPPSCSSPLHKRQDAQTAPADQISVLSPIMSSTFCEDFTLSTVNTSILHLPASPIADALPATPGQSDADLSPRQAEKQPYPVAMFQNVDSVRADALNVETLATEAVPDEACLPPADNTATSEVTDVVLAPSDEAEESLHAATDLPFKCPDCGRSYKLKSSLKRHMKTHTSPVKCTECDKTFCHSSALKRHYNRQHLGLRFPCNLCDRTFGASYPLKLHMAEHEGDYKYICDICGKGFSYKHHFEAHVSDHNNVKLYKCTTCNKDFVHSASYYRHVQVCGVKSRIPCTQCGKLFRAERYLKDHMAAHSETAENICHICGQAFSHRATLYKHMKVTHSSAK